MPTLKNAWQYHYHPQHFDPAYVPSSEEDVFTEDCFVEEISLSNIHNSSVTVLVKDKQTTPLVLLPTVSIAANSLVIARFSARFCPGGLTWEASVADKVIGYIRARVAPS